MSSKESLLKTICQNPAEADLRLAYADWLEKHDNQPRAEFIRVQIELARIEGDDSRRPGLAKRECELLRAHGQEWKSEFQRVGSFGEMYFSRGFISEINCASKQQFRVLGRPPLNLHPVTGMWISGDEKEMEACANWRGLSHMQNLGIFRPWPDGVAALFESPRAKNIEGLYLQKRGSSRRPYWKHTFSPIVKLLRSHEIFRLGISNANINGDSVQDLIDSGTLERLDSLTLDCETFRDGVPRKLAESPASQRLSCLRLSDSAGMSDRGLEHLISSPYLTQLKELSLLGARKLTPAGIKAIAEESRFQELTDLDLRFTSTDESCIASLTNSPKLPRLTRILLDGTPTSYGQKSGVGGSWASSPPQEHDESVLWLTSNQHSGGK